MRSWLEARGVPARDILSDDGGHRTRETMYRAMRYYGVTDAIVCTEAFAMPRTLFLARQNGIDAFGFKSSRHLLAQFGCDFRVRIKRIFINVCFSVFSGSVNDVTIANDCADRLECGLNFLVA